MVWLSHRGRKRPCGPPVASNVSIGGRSYKVWFGGPRARHGWNTVSYTMTTRTASVSKLDLQALVADAGRRGYISRPWYLIDVEAGFELCQGGMGVATHSVSVNVSAGSRGRHLACPAALI